LNKNRGPSPSDSTIRLLCVRSAGRCQFDGCNAFLFQDEITLTNGNFSNVVHNVASSPDGPRGDFALSHQLSGSIDNLLLLCPKHHKLIDDHPEIYTEPCLREMKKKHEKLIYEQCEMIGKPSSEILMFSSPIKGKLDSSINLHQAVDAIKPFKRPNSFNGIPIFVKSSADYNSNEYWMETERQLNAQFNRLIVNSAMVINPEQHFSVFPLAPIPLIIKLGYLMGDKIPGDIYQKIREPDTWKWLYEDQKNEFKVEKKVVRNGNKIALVMSLTADISEARVTQVFDADIIYFIRAYHFGVDAISSKADLKSFWQLYQKICDEISNKYTSTKQIHLFPAIPVSAAFEIGRRYMPGVYPEIVIYEENKGFIKAFSIGG